MTVLADVALVFPGQGSQRIGMLEALPSADGLERLIDAAERLSGQDLRTVAGSGTEEDLAATVVAQPLLYLADWAWGSALVESGVRPVAVAGHSLGELAALAVAGVYPVETGLGLVVERSRLMARACEDVPGGMAAVLGLDGDAVAAAIEGTDGVWVANDNCPGQVVISGARDAVTAAGERLTAAGARRVVPLAVSGPFHTPLMEGAAAEFAGLLQQTAFADAECPVVQNAEPSPTVDGSEIRERLSRQMVSPVRWTETMGVLAEMGATMLVEAGPGEVLAGLAKRVDGLEAVPASWAGSGTVSGRVGG